MCSCVEEDKKLTVIDDCYFMENSKLKCETQNHQPFCVSVQENVPSRYKGGPFTSDNYSIKLQVSGLMTSFILINNQT
jgi:hypothetical protein